ncbi:hypothetical protein BDZ91DRAFT_718894 [Kalaharituber pfeilii]|nr:hypothetical protein BDZ91DRAFT_718894 [Kalaharituber pfeilii]
MGVNRFFAPSWISAISVVFYRIQSSSSPTLSPTLNSLSKVFAISSSTPARSFF